MYNAFMSEDSKRHQQSAVPQLFLLDRDGVINVDVGPPGVLSLDQLELLPGSAAAVRCLNDAGCCVVVVTNQTSIGKGLLNQQQLDGIHDKLCELLFLEAGAKIDRILVATGGTRVKPSPDMLLEALQFKSFLASDAVMIGDKISDLEAGKAAGVRGILVTSSAHGQAASEQLMTGCHSLRSVQPIVYADLASAVEAELSTAQEDRCLVNTQDACGKAAWRTAALVVPVGLALVIAIVALRLLDTSPPVHGAKKVCHIIGWLGAAGAIVLFGSSQVLMKLPALETVEPAARAGIFAACSSLGNGLCNVALCAVLHWLNALQHIPMPRTALAGFLGATDICAIQLLAFAACSSVLGLTVAPAIWCGIGMSVSFTWGVTFFREPVRSPVGAALAVLLLCTGVALCAIARSDLPRRVARHIWSGSSRKPTQQSSKKQERHSTALATGFAIAFAVGLLDGSLLVPFKFLVLGHGDAGAIVAYQYLETFGAALLLLGSLMLAVQAALWKSRYSHCASPEGWFPGFSAALRICSVPGLFTGGFWALGNISSIHAAEYLGIAVGFPLTQLGIIVNALIGICVFGEMQNKAQLAACTSGGLVLLVGAALLGIFGHA